MSSITSSVPSASETKEGKVELATQAEMEAAADAARVAALDMLKHHPGVAKFWVNFNNAGTISGDYNVASVADNGLGDFSIVHDVDFSSVNYALAVILQDASLILNAAKTQSPLLAGSARIECRQNSGAVEDPERVMAVGFGDQ